MLDKKRIDRLRECLPKSARTHISKKLQMPQSTISVVLKNANTRKRRINTDEFFKELERYLVDNGIVILNDIDGWTYEEKEELSSAIVVFAEGFRHSKGKKIS